MPMQHLEVLSRVTVLQEQLATPEVTGIAVLSGVVVLGCFGLCYAVIKAAATDRDKDRAIREKDLEVRAREAEAVRAALEALRERRRAG
jgi:hypothetical protein